MGTECNSFLSWLYKYNTISTSESYEYLWRQLQLLVQAYILHNISYHQLVTVVVFPFSLGVDPLYPPFLSLLFCYLHNMHAYLCLTDILLKVCKGRARDGIGRAFRWTDFVEDVGHRSNVGNDWFFSFLISIHFNIT